MKIYNDLVAFAKSQKFEEMQYTEKHHIIMKSLEKKKDFMNNENNFFDNCDQAKTKLIEICREIDSYGNLI